MNLTVKPVFFEFRGPEIKRHCCHQYAMKKRDESIPFTPRWPYILWLSQLVLPLPVFAYGCFRIVNGPPIGEVMLPMVCISTFWIGVVVVTIFIRRGRIWVVSNRKKIILCFGTTTVALGACDLCLTATGVVPTITAVKTRSLEYRPAVSTIHRLIPKMVVRDDGPALRISSRGFRGKEIDIPKLKSTTRIIFFGGSHVFDFRGNDWVSLTGDLLSEMGKRVNVINAGVPGHRTADSVGKLMTDLWLLEPDVIVVCHAWNDIKYFSALNPHSPYRDLVVPPKHDWRLRPRGLDRIFSFSAFYRLGRTRLVGILIGEEGEEPRDPVGKINHFGLRQFKLNLETFCDMGRNLGVEVVLCKQARLPTANSSKSDRGRINYGYVGISHDELLRAFAECDRVIEEVSKEKHCHIVDMSTQLTGKSELFFDHIHFTPEGSQQAAQVMAGALASVIK